MNKHHIINEGAEKEYPALRFIAHLYKILGVLMGFVAISFIFFAIIGEFIGSGNSFGWVIILVSILIAPLFVISMFALSESIMIFIDVANNISRTKRIFIDVAANLSEIKIGLSDKSN